MKVFLDLELVSGQVTKVFETKDQRMKIYYDKATQLIKCFRRIDIHTIKRELNAKADKLVKGAAYGEYEKKNRLTTLNECSAEVNMIDGEEELESEVLEESWMDPIVDYLKNSKVPENKS